MITSDIHLHFLSGASGDPLFWQAVAQQLPAFASNITLQHYPAFSGYPNPERIQSFDQLCTWTLQQIQQPSIIIAQSMGGIFAIQAALQHPNLVQALVLCATSGGIDLQQFEVTDWREEYQLNLTDVPDWFVNAKVDLSPELPKIKLPVLLLWGDYDSISPISIGQYLQQQLPNAQLKIISGGQHNFAKVHAKQVAQYIDIFIQSLIKK